MTVKSSVVTVGVTATPLHVPTPDAIAGATVGVKVPAAGATVFVGGADVTTANGWPLPAGESLFIDVDTGDSKYVGGPTEDVVYGVVASGSQAVNVLIRGL